MATLLKTDGTKLEVHPANPKTGFTLDEIYKLTGCDIVQPIRLGEGRTLLVDENARMKTPYPPVNPAATELAQQAHVMMSAYILGDALIVSRKEFK